MAAHPAGLSALENLLPVPMIESVDVTEAMVYLCGQSGRYVTGITLPVDAGYTVKSCPECNPSAANRTRN
jgi:enoyl-[acyl-carrier-protein] reductase (NADH)